MISLGNEADSQFASDGAARGPRMVLTVICSCVLHMNLVQHLHEATADVIAAHSSLSHSYRSFPQERCLCQDVFVSN